MFKDFCEDREKHMVSTDMGLPNLPPEGLSNSTDGLYQLEFEQNLTSIVFSSASIVS